MRVLIADDKKTVRTALRRLLDEDASLSIVGEVVRAGDLIWHAQKTQPDLVLLDWELPGICGDRRDANCIAAQQIRQRFLRQLHALNSRPQIIALSCRPDDAQAALAAGVDVFVSKCAPTSQLCIALNAFAKTGCANYRPASRQTWIH